MSNYGEKRGKFVLCSVVTILFSLCHFSVTRGKYPQLIIIIYTVRSLMKCVLNSTSDTVHQFSKTVFLLEFCFCFKIMNGNIL